jgi:hypothetical protein
MNTEQPQLQNVPEEEKQTLNKRLESIAWGLFLIMVGGIAFVPDDRVPEGVWSIGVGLIMLGLNAARYFYGLKMSTFTIVLGFLALLTGIGDLFGLNLPVLAILLILIGANMILRPWFERGKTQGVS